MSSDGIRLVVTDFYNDADRSSACRCCDHSKGFGHRTYRGQLFDRPDHQVPDDAIIRRLIAQSGATDGDEIEIVAVKTGRRPYGDRRMVLVEPDTYAREPKRPNEEVAPSHNAGEGNG